jgi:Tat protein translocase TatB subunit
VFNLGGGEVIVIALLALIVLGPNRLPGAFRKAGEVLGDLRRISNGFQNEVRTALQDAEREAAAGDAPALVPPVDTPPPTDLAAALAQVSAQAEPPPKQAPARKTAAKKAPAKKAAAKKTAAKKTPAKKTAAKKAPGKKAPARKQPGS